MKYCLAALGMLFLALTVYAHNPDTNGDFPWIPFTWEPESHNGIPEKTKMSVPVRIAELSDQFEAQLDLDMLAQTMLNGYAFDRYFEKYPALKQRIDTTHYAYIQDIFCPFLKNIKLTLGEIAFPEKNIPLFYDYLHTTADSLSARSAKQIGTIAPDLFSDGVLVIDYPNERLCRLDKIPESWKKAFYFAEIRKSTGFPMVILPLKIAGSIRNVVFETRYNMFPLLSTPSKVSEIIATEYHTDSLSFGFEKDQINIYGYKIKGNVQFGPIVFDAFPVYETEYNDEDMDEAGVWGIIGNRYFLNRTIIIDYKNRRFGVSR